MKRKRNQFKGLSSTALGLGRLGVTLPVSAAAAGAASAGTPAAGIMGGFGAIASGAGIATTASVGGGLLGQLKQMNKPKKRRK